MSSFASLDARERINIGGGAAPSAVRDVLRTPGRPLDAPTRAALEPRFGHDFRDVRVHTDARASASATAIDALAYAAGNHIVFDAAHAAHADRPASGLLAHELAHVVQDSSSPASFAHGDLSIARADDAAERSADAAVHTLTTRGAVAPGSLRSASRAGAVHRAVTTWGGEWDTDTYDTVKTGAQEDGVEITLRFKPGNAVDATEIGMLQMVTSRDNGALVAVNPTVGARSLPAGTPGEGAHIDQLQQFRNPLYATGAGGANDKLWDTPTHPEWGRHGYHHVDKAGTLHHLDPLLKDRPQLPGRGPNASQIFESTAMAVTGVQTGAYYGSVQWGWKTDAAGNFTKLPLTKKSDDSPTGTFQKAQQLWNKSKDSAGNDLIKFYTSDTRFINAANVDLIGDPANEAATKLETLPLNTRVEVINRGIWEAFNKGAASKWWKITVVEGTAKGKVGWVHSSQLSATRATP